MTSSPFLSASPICHRRWLGIGLANLREQAGLHQRDAAARLDCQRATIGHYENGRNLPSVGDLEALLSLYNAAESIEHYRALREAARRGENWWRRISAVSDSFDHYLGLESGAIQVGSFDPMYMIGMLQTERYADAMTRADPSKSDERVHELVQVRLHRRHILERTERPASLHAVIDESVLYRNPVPSEPEVLREQLLSLREDLEHPQITLRILPLSAGAFPGMIDHPFKLLSFPPEMVGDHGTVYIGLHGEAPYLEEEGEVEQYEQGLHDLMRAAAKMERSRDLIDKALKEVT